MAENFDFHGRSEDLFQESIRAFAKWASENWTMKEGEADELNKPSPAPREYERGFNDAVATIADAADLWLDGEL
jgi:hypothetical protein